MAGKKKETIDLAKRKPVLVKKSVAIIDLPKAQATINTQAASKVQKASNKQLKKSESAQAAIKPALNREQKIWRLACRITRTLQEKNLQITHLIAKIIKQLGDETAQELVTRALTIHAGEGIWLHSKNRNRTLGGVFLYLVKEKINIADWRKMNPRRKATPIVINVDWEELLKEVMKSNPGEYMSVNIRLIGRPSTIQKNKSMVTFIMESSNLPTLPKGLPALKNPTKYLVMVATKQWAKVEAAIANPEDNLIIEGYGVFQPGFDGIVLMTASITTKHLQKNKAQLQQSETSGEVKV